MKITDVKALVTWGAVRNLCRRSAASFAASAYLRSRCMGVPRVRFCWRPIGAGQVDRYQWYNEPI